jgi:hypothetical protein
LSPLENILTVFTSKWKVSSSIMNDFQAKLFIIEKQKSIVLWFFSNSVFYRLIIIIILSNIFEWSY